MALLKLILIATAARYAVIAPLFPVALAEDISASGERTPGEDGTIDWGVESGLSSGYAWRGLVISDAPVARGNEMLAPRRFQST